MGGFVVFLNKVVPWQLQKQITYRKKNPTKQKTQCSVTKVGKKIHGAITTKWLGKKIEVHLTGREKKKINRQLQNVSEPPGCLTLETGRDVNNKGKHSHKSSSWCPFRYLLASSEFKSRIQFQKYFQFRAYQTKYQGDEQGWWEHR